MTSNRHRGVRPTGWIAVLVLVLILVGGCTTEQPPPSIVLITIDTIRADHLGCYGYSRDTSPVLDRFAADAILIEKVVAPMATTLPTHVSILTSTTTVRHGVQSNFEVLGESAKLTTFAEILGRLGYTTAAFVSATPLKKHTGIQRGFDSFNEPEETQRPADETTDRVLAWLHELPEGPYFVWVHYFDPHVPYRPPAPYDEMFMDYDEAAELLRSRGVSRWEDRRLRQQLNLYDGEIRFLDEQIGRLFEGLRERGDGDWPAVVLTGDHGEGLGQHNWLRHSQIFNEQLLVPLILRLPGHEERAGGRVTDLASPLDILPTLIETLELPVPQSVRAEFEGQNLFDPRFGRDYVMSERAHRSPWSPDADGNPPIKMEWRHEWEPGLKYALTGLDWKYVHLTERPDELYDLRRDPGETLNVIDDYPDVARELHQRLLAHVTAALKLQDPGAEAELSDETLDQLRALGYVQ